MTTEVSNETEARQQLASRLDALRRFNALTPYWGEQLDPDNTADRSILEDLGSPYDYGLSLEVESISPRWATKTYAWVLSTGGPHEEFDIEITHRGFVQSVTFVSMPWFGRVEIPLDGEATDVVTTFVERFLYLEGPYDAELGGDES